jgi:hypothetical protein
MSTYSTNLALELIGNGEQAGNWGQTTNTNLGTLVEQAISGYTTQAITDGADTTLTMTQGASATARNMYIELTGALTGARNLIVPSNKKLYFIYNNTSGGYAVTVKVSGQTGVSVPNATKTILVSNGTDIVLATTATAPGVTSVSGTGSVSGLTLSGTVTSTGSLTLGGSITGFATTSSNTFSGAQTINSNLTATGTSTLSGPVVLGTSGASQTISVRNACNFNYPNGGAGFGTASPDPTYAAYAKSYSSSSGGGFVAQNNGGALPFAAASDQGTGGYLFVFYAGTFPTFTVNGFIALNGAGLNYYSASDYRLKENVVPLSNAVTRLKQLAPKNYTWIDHPNDGLIDGFIAHEVQEVMPQAASGHKDEVGEDGNPKYQGVDTSVMVPLLTAALQEAIARIEALEAKVG